MIVVILAIAGVAGAAYYYWQQATSLPNWYQKSAENTNKPTEVPAVVIEKKSGGEVKLNRQQLDRFITDNLARDSKLQQVLSSTKAIHSDIKDGKLEIGAIVNTANLSQINLSANEQFIIEQLMQKIPQLQNRDIYVSVQGTPQIKDGKIILAPDSKIKIGNLSFTPAEIAAKLNIPVEKIQQNLTIDIQRFSLQDIQLNQDEIKLKFKQLTGN